MTCDTRRVTLTPHEHHVFYCYGLLHQFDRHDITEKLLKVALNTITLSTNGMVLISGNLDFL
jgi:hypothetical protein